MSSNWHSDVGRSAYNVSFLSKLENSFFFKKLLLLLLLLLDGPISLEKYVRNVDLKKYVGLKKKKIDGLFLDTPEHGT